MTTPESFSLERLRELHEQVLLFKTLRLPGQPMMMHMGTSQLVSDLDNALTALADRLQEAETQRTQSDAVIAHLTRRYGDFLTIEQFYSWQAMAEQRHASRPREQREG